MGANLFESLRTQTARSAEAIQPLFADRQVAGWQLAELLEKQRFQNVVIVAILTGGLLVGHEVQKVLSVPLVGVVASKVADPKDARFGLGTVVAEGGECIDHEFASYLGFSHEEVKDWTSRAHNRANSLYQNTQQLFAPVSAVAGNMALIVDDGIATGQTIFAVIKHLRQHSPDQIVVSTPVGHADALRRIEETGIPTFALHTSNLPYFIVDKFYDFFPQLTLQDIMSYN